jgi:phosphoglucosamine mutase
MACRPKLFGTDGMRGVAGCYPLDAATVRKFGKVLGRILQKHDGGARPRVVLGEDTRESSCGVSQALAAGLGASGSEVVYAGVITTPGVAFLTRQLGFTAGVMVSASHNPYNDNGIKVFSSSGLKLPAGEETEIELALEKEESCEGSALTEPLLVEPGLLDQYLRYLQAILPANLPLPKAPLVVDCAHGAGSRVVPELLRNLGIEARILNASPNGRNINHLSGSLFPEGMARETRSSGAHLGVAFDGDADRAIFATADGRIADGDHVLYAAAPFWERNHKLKGHTVVGTLMTNLGLEIALERFGIGLKRTAVGDKYVLEEILKSGYNLGGEPSGHIIFADLSLAGDGIITLLQVLRLVAESGTSFAGLVSGLEQFPQLIRNVPVREKPPLESLPEVTRAIEACRDEIGARGRVIVRYSGTEPLARVMVEAEDAENVRRQAARIADAIERAIGLR